MSNSYPKGWNILPLSEVSTLQRGYDLPVKKRIEGTYPVFAANGPIGTHNEAKVSGPGVVTGRSGTIGKVHYVDVDYWPLNTSLYVKDFHGNHPRFVYYLLSNMHLERFHAGTGVPTLNRNNVHGVPIPLPPLPEQKRIATILDAADALRAKRRESIEQLDSLIQSTFLEMFGDPVTNVRFPIEPMTEIVSRFIDYRGKSPRKVSDGIPLITAKIIKEKVVVEPNEFIPFDEYSTWMRRGIPSPGDVIITTEAPMGEVAQVPNYKAAFAQRLLILQPTKSKINSAYLMWSLTMPFAREQMRKRSTGSTVVGIRSKEFKKLVIPLPPLDLQTRFASIVESIEQQKTRLKTHLGELDTLFASLQSRAFNGELMA